MVGVDPTKFHLNRIEHVSGGGRGLGGLEWSDFFS